jgi:hypothetical protein
MSAWVHKAGRGVARQFLSPSVLGDKMKAARFSLAWFHSALSGVAGRRLAEAQRAIELATAIAQALGCACCCVRGIARGIGSADSKRPSKQRAGVAIIPHGPRLSPPPWPAELAADACIPAAPSGFIRTLRACSKRSLSNPEPSASSARKIRRSMSS